MQCRVVKGGWSWLGITRNAGEIIAGQSDAWIANRVADGLVEPIPVEAAPEVPAPIETAAIAPAENATLPSQRESAKQRK